MLEFYIPSKKKTWFGKYTPKPVVEIGPVNSMFKEAARRDAVIKDLASKCKYVVGDTCIATTPEDIEKYGDVTITGIADSYAKFGRSNWPTTGDNALIVEGLSEKSGMFFCTTNYLVKKET